jgi:AP-3 complex subunit delta-1
LAASQSFHEGTDVLMLTTNMIRKDLGSQNMYEAGIALSGLSCFLSADLARDLANEIMTLVVNFYLIFCFFIYQPNKSYA